MSLEEGINYLIELNKMIEQPEFSLIKTAKLFNK